jgi:transposase
MFGLSAPVRVDLTKQPTAIRKSFDGLVALASGGLALVTQAEFHHYRQISLHSFRKHLDQPVPSTPVPSDGRSSASADHHFLPVTIFPDPILSITVSQPHLELILSNGRRIAVAPGFDPQTLHRLITVVEERPCLD